jgi:hypothetical protein
MSTSASVDREAALIDRAAAPGEAFSAVDHIERITARLYERLLAWRLRWRGEQLALGLRRAAQRKPQPGQ